jgi:KaiC/GvpD/RAD55 family RecA-like ATPase
MEKDRQNRLLTSRNVLNQDEGELLQVDNPVLAKAIGRAIREGGCWLIYGKEKNGKTALAIKTALALCNNYATDYISAEEGTKGTFRQALKRAGVNDTTKIKYGKYEPLPVWVKRYRKPKSSKIIFVDNLTIYTDEFKDMPVLKVLKALEHKTLIFLSHEDRGEPDSAPARLIKKMASVIFHVEGLKVTVTSRYEGGGGSFLINREKGELYWGEEGLPTI